MKGTRVLELDSMRGLAAIAVVIFHYFYRYNELYSHNNIGVEWSALGKHGVEVFFMISGFVIFWSLQNIKHPLDFIVSRFSRLYPVYWVSVALTFTLVSLVGLEGRDVSFKYALMNLTMLQGFLQVPSVDGVYWTLMVELLFYFWMLLLFIFKQHDRADVFFGCFVLIKISLVILSLEVSGVFSKLMLLDYISFFASGICFYKIVNGKDVGRAFLVLIICLLSTAVIYTPLYFLFFLIIYFVFFMAITGRIKFMANKYLVFLGSISYALYLIHQNIGYMIINYFYMSGLDGLLEVVVALSISILLASILTSRIEKPALVVVRKFYGIYKSNRS